MLSQNVWAMAGNMLTMSQEVLTEYLLFMLSQTMLTMAGKVRAMAGTLLAITTQMKLVKILSTLFLPSPALIPPLLMYFDSTSTVTTQLKLSMTLPTVRKV